MGLIDKAALRPNLLIVLRKKDKKTKDVAIARDGGRGIEEDVCDCCIVSSVV